MQLFLLSDEWINFFPFDLHILTRQNYLISDHLNVFSRHNFFDPKCSILISYQIWNNKTSLHYFFKCWSLGQQFEKYTEGCLPFSTIVLTQNNAFKLIICRSGQDLTNAISNFPAEWKIFLLHITNTPTVFTFTPWDLFIESMFMCCLKTIIGFGD